MAKKKANSIKTPERAVMIDDIMQPIGSDDLSDMKIIVSSKKSGYRSIDATMFLNQFTPLIGTYVYLSSNKYDYSNIVPCLGGRIYPDDFEDNLSLFSSRFPTSFQVFKAGKLDYINIPNCLDRILEFDPALDWGELQDEGIEERLLDVFDDYSEHQAITNIPKSLNSDNYIYQPSDSQTQSTNISFYISEQNVNLSGGIEVDSSNLRTQNAYFFDSSYPRYCYAHEFGIKSSLTGTKYYRYLYQKNERKDENTSLDYADAIYKYLDISGKITTKNTLKGSISGKNVNSTLNTKNFYRLYGIDKNKVRISQRTRERTMNALIGVYTGLMKKSGNTKKFYVTDGLGRCFTSLGVIEVLESTKRYNEPILQGSEYMIEQKTDYIHPSILPRLFIQASKSDTFGIVSDIDKEAIGARKIFTQEKYQDKSFDYSFSPPYEKTKRGFIIESTSNTIFFNFWENEETNNVYKLSFENVSFTTLPLSEVEQKTTNGWDFLGASNVSEAKINSVKITKIQGQEVKTLTTPEIFCYVSSRGRYGIFQLFYLFKGISQGINENRKTHLLYRPLDSTYFGFLKHLNSGETGFIDGFLKTIPSIGISNPYTVGLEEFDKNNSPNTFFFTVTETLFSETSKDLEAQDEIVEKFKAELKERKQKEAIHNKIKASDFDIFTFFENNVLLVNGRRLNLFSEVKNGKYYIGAKAEHKGKDSDPFYCIVFEDFDNPTIEDQDETINHKTEVLTAKVIKIKNNANSKASFGLKDATTGALKTTEIQKINEPIYIITSENVLLLSFPSITKYPLSQKLTSWTDTTITQDEIKKITEKVPLIFENDDNNDDLGQAGQDGIKKVLGTSVNKNRFYLKLKGVQIGSI